MLREPKMRPTTQAAEGVPRMRWTLAEFVRVIDVGILTEDDRDDLIQGPYRWIISAATRRRQNYCHAGRGR